MENRQPASTGTTLPPVITSVTLRLRPRPVSTPSPSAFPATTSGGPVLEAVDGGGAPQQLPLRERAPLIPPVVSWTHGVVDGEGPPTAPAGSPLPVFLATRDSDDMIHPDPGYGTTTAGTSGQGMHEPASGAVHGEGVPPQPPLPAGAALTPPLTSGGLGDMYSEGLTRGIAPSPLAVLEPEGSSDGCRVRPQLSFQMPTTGTINEGLPPAPAPTAKRSRTANPPLLPPANSDASESPSVHWGDWFPVDVVVRIASMLRSSRIDVESMRFVCKTWREAIPSTMGPSLVLSKKMPSSDSRLIILEISSGVHGATMQHKVPLVPTPVGASCWGSALGLVALTTSNHGSFVYCVHCASLKQLLKLPLGALPNGIFLEPHSPVRFVLMKLSGSEQTVLRVDRTDFPWDLDNELTWLPYPGFNEAPLISVALSSGILRAAVSTDSIILIDESGRPLNDIDGMLSVQAPLTYEDGQLASVWTQNGRHMFLCNGKVYYVEIFDSADAPAGVAARLFFVEKMEAGDYSLNQVQSIGPYALYLGSNQAFVMPSADKLVGWLANTLYVEDYRSKGRSPRILALNMETLVAFTIPFPEDISASVSDLLPAAWVGLPVNKDLHNHCKSNEHWGWWD